MLAGFALVAAFGNAAAADRLTNDELRELSSAVADPARASEAVARLRAFLASGAEPAYQAFARRALVQGLLTSGAPTSDVIAEMDTLAPLVATADPRQRAMFYGQVAQQLLNREPVDPRTLDIARTAYQLIPPGDPRNQQLSGATGGILGMAQLKLGYPDSAIVTLNTALPDVPDSQFVLFSLGEAYAMKKQDDRAIGYYTRALGVYLSGDTSAAAPLRELWKKKRGSLKGMDEAIAVSRRASRQRIAFDGRREDRPAPPWTLFDLNGQTVALSDFKGKIVVMDFWGSWCGPCRVEMPIFQRVYEKYRDKGVVFLGMNWEQPQGTAEQRLQKVRDYIAQNKYTFPIVIDHDRLAVEPYEITGFPTVFLVDKQGQIRYRNTGVADGIETILSDQIESLMR